MKKNIGMEVKQLDRGKDGGFGSLNLIAHAGVQRSNNTTQKKEVRVNTFEVLEQIHRDIVEERPH